MYLFSNENSGITSHLDELRWLAHNEIIRILTMKRTCAPLAVFQKFVRYRFTGLLWSVNGPLELSILGIDSAFPVRRTSVNSVYCCSKLIS